MADETEQHLVEVQEIEIQSEARDPNDDYNGNFLLLTF